MSSATVFPPVPTSTALSPMLARLADERATGALLRDHGTLYLADGKVVHAESPAAPGLDVLLHGRLPREGWQEAFDRAGPAGRVGRFLVDSGRLADGELELAHLGALFDAAYFALAPGSGPTRFRHGVAHWMGPVRPVPARTVARECLRRRQLLDSLWPHPEMDNSPVGPGDTDLHVTRRQQDVLDLADGVRTPADIARALGRPAFHTLVDIRRLAAAGAVTTPAAAPPPTPVPRWVADMKEDPDVALLRRLRDALEAL
ncbi:transcriptional regulator [Streptomyces sp. NPDC091272]|uniref:transcriptional regulator n=1 Tax=Streptomyces sp. NPDC091272 TaxID=3365981 RepID=UPI00382346E0